ncbi:MAG: hypothetical protein LBK99_02585 [Opitutaceae bacterium]|nr:hypothetical protein [Opitutaceae bacterium]
MLRFIGNVGNDLSRPESRADDSTTDPHPAPPAGCTRKNPSAPRHGQNGRGCTSLSTNPHGPTNHGESDRATQSTSDATPTMPPRARPDTPGKAASTTPRKDKTARTIPIPSANSAPVIPFPAWIRNRPRNPAAQVRFSTSFPA